jgi:hypothetical protein
MSIDRAPGGEEMVVGVVDMHGAGGIKTGAAWTLQFGLDTWRREDGASCSTPLAVAREVTIDELRQHMNRIRGGEIITARVRLVDAASAVLLGLLDRPIDPDDPLAARVRALTTPQTRTHPLFGTLTLDRRVDWYEATTTWSGAPVRLSLPAMDDEQLEAALACAVELWNAQSSWSERVREFAADKLLGLKNGSWLGDDDDEVTRDEFKRRMVLRSITVHPEGEVEFWHDDGDLFWGHSIHVSGSLQDGPTDADIPG